MTWLAAKEELTAADYSLTRRDVSLSLYIHVLVLVDVATF